MPLLPKYDWMIPKPREVAPDVLALAEARGVGRRLLRVLARRGELTAEELRSYIDPPVDALHDPMLLPDAALFVARVRLAGQRGERALVFGDFDADGLTGLAILTRALRHLGIDAAPYVPSRLEEGHGLSLPAIERAVGEGRTLIVTVDCGTTSVAEIAAARARGIDVLVTDHHAVPAVLPDAAAIVNAHRPGSRYPDPRLSGAGVAFKLAEALMADQPGGREWALRLADLACIGSVADVVPISGENRAILRLGVARMARDPRPGLAALMAVAGIDPRRVDVETIGFAIAPRINAVGRIGEAGTAAELLLTDDAEQATALAEHLQQANLVRRELMTAALDEARAVVAADETAANARAIIVSGAWPVGIIGLVAGRLAEERGVPAVVFSTSAQPWRGSARSVPGFDLAAAFTSVGDLFERFGGHPAAAGCHLPEEHYEAFRVRFSALAAALPAPVADGAPTPHAAPQPARRKRLTLDLVLRAESADYVLLRELSPLDEGADEPPLVGLAGFTVARVREVTGGHAQLTLRRGIEVLDAICFGRSDLAGMLTEGSRIDLVARLSSRTFAGLETLQLDVRDIAPAGWLQSLASSGGEPVAFAIVPTEERAQALSLAG